MTIDERMIRLERAFITFVALSSGEGTPEEVEVAQHQLGTDLTGIKDTVVELS